MFKRRGKQEPCRHFGDKGQSLISNRDSWRDTAKRLWNEDECRGCGRLWRYLVNA